MIKQVISHQSPVISWTGFADDRLLTTDDVATKRSV